MGLPSQTSNSPHLYSQELQLKLYQAFIFSIPILFSIILFLLFYLFYLKRRASSLSSPPRAFPGTSNGATPSHLSSACQVELTKELKNNLPIVLFDEELRTRDSHCCVCLGEFEIKEELLQIPACKHVFHIECIHHWLHSNSTCPLCRCFVLPMTTTITRLDDPADQSNAALATVDQDNAAFFNHQQLQAVGASSSEQIVILIGEESRVERSLTDSGRLPGANLEVSSNQEHIVVQMPTHET